MELLQVVCDEGVQLQLSTPAGPQSTSTPTSPPSSLAPHFTPPITQALATSTTQSYPPSVITLDAVYLNGLHALRWIHVRNPSIHRVSVRIKSNLGAQIAFQLSNENLRPPLFSPFCQTLSPDASTEQTLDHSEGTHHHQFNQLFNYVNYIDSIDLDPGQVTRLVLAFLPDDHSLANGASSPDHIISPESRSNRDPSDDHTPPQHHLNPIETGQELHDFYEINGLIFFFAFIKPPTASLSLSPTDPAFDITTPRPFPATDFTHTPKPNYISSSSPPTQTPTSFLPPPILTTPYSTGMTGDAVVVSPSSLSNSSSGRDFGRDRDPVGRDSGREIAVRENGREAGSPDFQVTLKFRSRVCRSVLWTDIGETGIAFEGCVVGGTYFRDFSIWNKSEIDLHWILNTIDLSNRQPSNSSNTSLLTFSEYDPEGDISLQSNIDDAKSVTSALQSTSNNGAHTSNNSAHFTNNKRTPIPSYSQRRIRVTFKPTEPGEFRYTLQLENVNDSAGNTVEALLHANVKRGAVSRAGAGGASLPNAVVGSRGSGRSLASGGGGAGNDHGLSASSGNSGSGVDGDSTASGGVHDVPGNGIISSGGGVVIGGAGNNGPGGGDTGVGHGDVDEDLLQVSCVDGGEQAQGGSAVDFGDCYTGVWYKKLIRIKNLGRFGGRGDVGSMKGGSGSHGSSNSGGVSGESGAVEVFLGVEDFESGDVVFQLKARERPGQSEHQRHSNQLRRSRADDLEELRAGGRGSVATRISVSNNSVGSRGRLMGGEDRSLVRGAGTGVVVRIREGVVGVLSHQAVDSMSASELSNPSSSFHSRASSPAGSMLHRLNSETMTIGSSADLTDLIRKRGADDEIGTGAIGEIGDGEELGLYGSSFGTIFNDKRILKDGEEVTRIEELTLRPGVERVIELCYRPAKEHTADGLQSGATASGRLVKRNFRVVLSYVKHGSHERERKIVQCKARICTSIVDVFPKELNFGDTDVGTLKSLPIHISNLSDLPARVEVQFVSKVLHCYKGELIIPPRQSIEVKMDIYPRKVNPDYSKQITVVNMNNSDNDQIVEVKSTHIDKNRVTFHSLFYRILTPTASNFVDFGSVVFGAPIVRSFTIENTSKKRLRVELSSSMPDEIQIYMKSTQIFSAYTPAVDSTALKEHLIDSLGGKRATKRNTFSPILDGNSSTNPLLSSSTTSHPKDTELGMISPIATTASAIDRVASLIAVERPFENAPDGMVTNDVENADYLDLASLTVPPQGAHHYPKDVRMSPRRNLASAAVATYSEALKHLRDQYNRDRLASANLPGGGGVGSENDGESGSEPQLGEGSRVLSASQLLRAKLIQAAKSTPVREDSVGAAAKVNVDAFLKSIEDLTGVNPPVFSKQLSEEKYVKTYQLLQRELSSLLKDGKLIPITEIEMEPGKEASLVVVLTALGSKRPFIQTKAKKHDAKIFIKLLEFDREIHQPQFEQLLNGDSALIPVRELMLRSSLCRSVMELGQRNINFGFLDKNESQTKTIVLRNKSEAPLFYYVRKSGSISSGDLSIADGRIGLIRGYGKKEIDFMFEPSLPGSFQEKLIVENLQDRENDQVVTIKAQIRQPSKFSIEPSELDFGPCLMNEFSGNIQLLVVSNTSSKPRTFEVHVDDEKLEFKGISLDVRLEVLGDGADGTSGTVDERANHRKKQNLPKEILEKIEELEQKIKIYNRKGKMDKVQKAQAKLEKLRSGNTEDDIGKSKDEVVDTGSASQAENKDVTEGVGNVASNSGVATSHRSKYVSKSLVVVVEARGTKTIALHVKPSRKHSSIRYDWDTEICHGSILVNEFKNTDVVKSVPFRVMACFDASRFEELLLIEGIQILGQNPINAEVEPVDESIHETNSDVLSLLSAATKPSFSVELTAIDLGRLEVNLLRDCYFTMFNQTDETIDYEIDLSSTDSCVICKELTGSLQPRESRRIFLQLLPSCLGRQSHCFAVRSLLTVEQITFSFFAMLHSYLTFPGIASSSPQIDFGPCYISHGRKYAKVQSVEVINSSEIPIVVSVTSNLTQQCFIFRDKDLEISAAELPMQPSEHATIYVALQPSVVKISPSTFQSTSKGAIKSSNNLITSDPNCIDGSNVTSSPERVPEKASSESSRTLIGGIRFSVNVAVEVGAADKEASPKSLRTDLFYVLTQTVKFSAVIGVSNFSVDESLIDLGRSFAKTGRYFGKLTVVNRSPRLPLDFTVESSSADLKVDVKQGFIPSVEEESTSSCLPNFVIPFALVCNKWGFIKERITVRNVNNQNQTACVEVRFFADSGSTRIDGIAMYAPSKVLSSQDSGYSKSFFESKLDEEPSQPVLWWDDVYVVVNPSESGNSEGTPNISIQKKATSDVAPSYERSFDFINETDELLEVVAKPSLGNGIRWRLSGGSGFVMTSNVDIAQTGSLLLKKHQKASVYVTVHNPPQSDDVCRRLLSGRNVTVRGLLLLENPEKGVALKTIDLIASYGLSLGGIDPGFIDLGRVGHLNNWEDVPFSFKIVNNADCVLRYEVELPEVFELLRILSDNGSTATKRSIEAGKFHSVEAVLKPRKIETSKLGPNLHQITVLNIFNPRNTLLLDVRSVLTLMDLKFERLVDGELVLPPLVYPSVSTSTVCDNWFKIVSKSELDLKFEVEYVPSPDVADFLRLEIVSRSTNSHLNGIITLEPFGVLDVRVRAFLRDGARLLSSSEISKFLTNSVGVTMGSLMIINTYAAPAGSDATTSPKRMSQHIPLRCTIVEGPTFTINERRLKFSCFPNEQDDHSVIQVKQISLVNNSNFFPLNFRVAVDYPLEFPLGTNLIEISNLGPENEGYVEAGGQLTLSVTFLKSNISGISESVKLHIYDMNSVSSYFQTVQISITENSNGYGASTLESLSFARYVDSEREDSLPDAAAADFGASLPGDFRSYSEQDLSVTEDPLSLFDDGEVSVSESTSISVSNPSHISGTVEKLPSQYSQSNRSNFSETQIRRNHKCLLNLRGCKRVVDPNQQAVESGGLFVLDLGQQDTSATIITKRIVLESTGNDKVTYKIRTLAEIDKSWLLISRTDGAVDARNPSHSINLNFVVHTRGMYSTYLLIENSENMPDSKIIRVTMEVVGKHQLRKAPASSNIAASPSTAPSNANPAQSTESNNVFDVIVAGLDPIASEGLSNNVITMDGLYYDMEYTARSIMIQNHEAVPLEFFIKSNLKSTDPTELIFSLSRSAAKVFRSVIVQPESYLRVFIRFRPSLGEMENDHDDRGDGLTEGKMDLSTANNIDEKVVEISVHCRLVKDYQKTIVLRARCRKPQIDLPIQELFWKGRIVRKAASATREGTHSVTESVTGGFIESADPEWEIKLPNLVHILPIENRLETQLEFEVLNDSIYFGVDVVDVGADDKDEASPLSLPFPRKASNCTAVVDPFQTKNIRVFPIMSALMKDMDILRRDKYFVEHITLYNKKRPSEKFWIVLKLSLGHLNHFQVATGSRHSYLALEGHIVRLLREINANPSVFNVLVDISTEANVGNEKAAEVYFRYLHIVEDLIYFGTREQASDYVQLAALLFCGVLKRPTFLDQSPSSIWSTSHRQWPPALAKWISLFLYLLSFFPHSAAPTNTLRELSRALIVGAPLLEEKNRDGTGVGGEGAL
ncbi:hypothetical protein BJ741DRAFT_706290 [Chytriomyces cf. hyalinus JEL632]|nr:hypothetical protein BJ741DRAFT_706290 [Chytriomyces cf. hyalinus JEL632]